jgi:hypothetical protein
MQRKEIGNRFKEIQASLDELNPEKKELAEL